MIPTSLTISGFRSFREPQTLRFPTGPGLYFLRGINEVEPELEANGSGKSSVWDALLWCHSGKSARGLKSPKLANWTGDCDMHVKFCFENNSRDYELRRTWKPNSLVLDDKSIEQREVDDLLLPFDQFVNATVMGQFTKWFFDRTSTQRLDVFSAILNLEVWIAASKQASKAASAFDSRLNRVELNLESASAKLKTNRAARMRLIQARKKYDKERADLADAAQAEVDKADDKVGKLKKLYVRARDANDELQEEKEQLERALNKLLEAQREAKQIKAQASRVLESAQDEVTSVAKEIEAAKEESSACPYCERAFDEEHRRLVLRRLSKTLKKREAEVNDLEIAAVAAADELEAVTGKVEEQSEEFAECGDEAQEAADKFARLNSKLTAAKTERQLALAEFNRHSSDEDPFKKEIKELTDLCANCLREETKLSRELKSIEGERAAIAYWPKGFKELRLSIIEEALVSLGIQVNSCLVDLGLVDWKVEFDVERETQKGGMQSGFHVIISPPVEVGEPVPWEAWSGGETQRLRVAGAVGLRNLIVDRSTFKPMLEVWDEPTAHLTRLGVQDLLHFLKDRAEHRMVFLTDHRSFDSGAFDGIWTVRKTAHGSVIEEE